MNRKTLSLISCFLLFISILSAQDKSNVKFGKITVGDFDLSNQKYDSGAAAVIIADIGDSRFEGNTKSYFSIIFNHFKRAKIINKNGIDIATVEIPLYTDGKAEEKLLNLKAKTYNLENGKIEETKLDEKSVFTERRTKNLIIKKFTFPAVKEGSIIEFSYTQSSDFLFELQPWEFQGEYPRLWSEYEVAIPEYFFYTILTQGYQPFAIKTQNTVAEHFQIWQNDENGRSQPFSLEGTSTDSRFVMKNVPALKEENFTTTLSNHIAKIEFQLSTIHFPYSSVQDIMGNWVKLNESMMESEDFGADINKNNGWLSDDLKLITAGASTKEEKARKIFEYLKNNFVCKSHSKLYIDNSLKTVFKNKSGSEAEINLLMTAMLNHEDITANPVILSTKDNGFANEFYPLIGRYNYVISMADIDGKKYFLDASQPLLGFNRLTYNCYNGQARIISKEMQAPIYFQADSLNEQKMTNVIISNDENAPSDLNGSFVSYLGENESYNLREKLLKKSEQDYFKEIKLPNGNDIIIQNGRIDSLKSLDNPIAVNYDFLKKNFFVDDIVYMNPMMGEGYKENPFKSAVRLYPVEMPYAFDELYNFTMEIPKGYEVDEIPKSAKVVFNENEGYFEYLVVKSGDNIQLRSRVKLNKANYKPEDYNSLRDFFAFIVKKQNEQIVFKKKK